MRRVVEFQGLTDETFEQEQEPVDGFQVGVELERRGGAGAAVTSPASTGLQALVRMVWRMPETERRAGDGGRSDFWRHRGPWATPIGGRGKQKRENLASMLVFISVILGFSRYGETSRRQAKCNEPMTNEPRNQWANEPNMPNEPRRQGEGERRAGLGPYGSWMLRSEGGMDRVASSDQYSTEIVDSQRVFSYNLKVLWQGSRGTAFPKCPQSARPSGMGPRG